MVEPSVKRNLIVSWLSWHYGEAVKDLLKIAGNFISFNFRFFSIKELAKTLFSYWRHYKEDYGRGFSPKRYAYVFLANMISRLLGAFVRILVIFAGLISEIFILSISAIALTAWIFFPILTIISFYWGIYYLII